MNIEYLTPAEQKEYEVYSRPLSGVGNLFFGAKHQNRVSELEERAKLRNEEFRRSKGRFNSLLKSQRDLSIAEFRAVQKLVNLNVDERRNFVNMYQEHLKASKVVTDFSYDLLDDPVNFQNLLDDFETIHRKYSQYLKTMRAQ